MLKEKDTQKQIQEIKNAFEPVPIFAQDYVDKVVPFINNVQEEIRIIIFDWRIPEDGSMSRVSIFNDAIFKAVSRGVKVRAIVSSEKVKSILEKMGVFAKVWPTDRRLHTKLLILDRFHIVLGSHNFTESAFSSNHELSTFFIVSEYENAFVNYFENMWTN
jgi:phosphatidylserine/phosphatidylglycerophosphate/cardiolipin synthase-like enzyme